MRETKRLRDIYRLPAIHGIFEYMSQHSDLIGILFNNIISTGNIHSLDIDYIYNRSGDKKISRLLEHIYSGFVVDDNQQFAILQCGKMVTFTDKEFFDEFNKRVVTDIISIKYYNKWAKSYDALMTEYKALNPYNMEVTDGLEINRTSASESGSSSESTYNDNTYAFNSSEPTPTSSGNSTDSGSTTSSRTDIDKHKRNLTRSGNIGNKSAMQLLKEELEFRKNLIVEEIYSDLDKVLTRNHY